MRSRALFDVALFALFLSVFAGSGLVSGLSRVGFKNLVNAYLVQAAIDYSVGEPGRPTVEQMISGISAMGFSSPKESTTAKLLHCLKLRSDILALDWKSATERLTLVSLGLCTPDILLDENSWSGKVLRGIDMIQAGEILEGNTLLHNALLQKGELLGPSLKPWLCPEGTLDAVTQELDTIKPEYYLGRQIGNQWHVVPEVVDADWSLIGFSLNELHLERGCPIDAVLYWLPNSDSASVPRDWSPQGSMWKQRVTLLNLVPNAGFEWDAAFSTEAPLGYTEDWSNNPTERARSLELRVGRWTHVASLISNDRGKGASLISTSFPVSQDSVFLQAGWMRGSGAWLGTHWTASDGWTNHPVANGNYSDWTYVATLVHPALENSVRARVTLMKGPTPGAWAEFDDILFVQLPLP